MKTGKIVQVMGPVVDVFFEDDDLPYIKEALEVDNNGKRCVMEVAQHVGNHTVRCIMLSASEGLHRDMEVKATGSGIKVPVGDKTLGRLFNVLERRSIRKEVLMRKNTGSFTEIPQVLKTRARLSRYLRPVLRLSICWLLMLKAERSAFSAAPVWVRQCLSRN